MGRCLLLSALKRRVPRGKPPPDRIQSSAPAANQGYFNGDVNHVHLLVHSLKGVSFRRMRQEFSDLVRHYWRANRLWSGSSFAGSLGEAPLSVLRQYIDQQQRPI